MLSESLKQSYLLQQRQCALGLLRHPPQTMAEELNDLALFAQDFAARDVYGTGDLVTGVEREIAALLGKPAALYFPTGTLAQPVALKIWADEKSCNRFAMHSSCHIELHEQQGYSALYGLEAAFIGTPDKVPTLADIQRIKSPLSAIVLELPMREIGGQLPEWDVLVSISEWARTQGIACHLDGARLWQCAHYYGKTFAEIAALFDTVYVSLYKDLGGISGAVLLGSTDCIKTATTWARRAGGNVVTAYPALLSAKKGLAENLPQMSEYAKAATWLAAWFNRQPEAFTTPTVPQTNMFHLFIEAESDVLMSRCISWMAEHGVAVLPLPRLEKDGLCCFEINLGRNVLQRPKQWWNAHLTAAWAHFFQD